MNLWRRIISVVFSLLIAVGSVLAVLMLLSEYIMSAMIAFFLYLQKNPTWCTTLVVISVCLFIAATVTLLLSLMDARLRKARVRSSNLGSIDIGVGALENIALNAAKSAQSGVKSVKARVFPNRGDKIDVRLYIVTYSDVEIPSMMNKVQERVKKDIERYTGIEVVEVPIKVSQVEAISARMGR